jgi:predicted PurR-regulated permease PerM
VAQYVRQRVPPGWLTRILVALLLVRFIMPVAALSSELAYQAFMADDYARSQQGIEQSAAALGALDVKDDAPKWWEVRERIEQIKAMVERTVDHSIRIAVVFLLQTLVLPLLAFWILLRSSRMLMTGRVPGA